MLEDPEAANRLFGFYRGYTDGFLPFAGAITDQPNNVVIAFQDISIAKGVLDQEDAEDAGNDNPIEEGRYKSVLGKGD